MPSKPNIFLFHGENTFLISEKLHFWQQKFIEKHAGDINCSVITADKNTRAKDLLVEAETMPFLGEKRLIIVKEFLTEAKKEEQIILSERLGKIPESTIFVMAESEPVDKRTGLFKKLSKIGKAEEFSALEGRSLNEWIALRARQLGAQIKFPEINYLVEHTGNNLWHLKNELEKLAQFAAGRLISRNDIDQLSQARVQMNIFKLTDFLGQKNIKSAMETLEKLVNGGEDPHFIFHMIVRQFRIIIQVAELQESGTPQKEMIAKLKMKPFLLITAAKQARNFNLTTLKQIYQMLLDIEIAQKTGKIRQTTSDHREFTLALEKFIVKSCK